MRYLVLGTPEMPHVLDDHDVFREDWVIFMNDLSLAWNGHFPLTGLKSNTTLQDRVHTATDLMNEWNQRFFLARRAEIVLCMEEQKSPSPRTMQFTLYLTHPQDPAETLGARNELLRCTLAPPMHWVDSIPEYVRDVVPVTGWYAQHGHSQTQLAVGNASVEVFSMERSELVGQRRRVYSTI